MSDISAAADAARCQNSAIGAMHGIIGVIGAGVERGWGGDLSREWVAGQCQCAARDNGAPTERTPVTSPRSVPSTVDNHRACESMACLRHAFVHVTRCGVDVEKTYSLS